MHPNVPLRPSVRLPSDSRASHSPSDVCGITMHVTLRMDVCLRERERQRERERERERARGESVFGENMAWIGGTDARTEKMRMVSLPFGRSVGIVSSSFGLCFPLQQRQQRGINGESTEYNRGRRRSLPSSVATRPEKSN